jgi:hypothetical protein
MALLRITIMTQLVVVSVVAELLERSNHFMHLRRSNAMAVAQRFVGSVPLSGKRPFVKERLAHALLNPKRGS